MNLIKNKNLKIVYFGGEPLGTPVLEELEKAGILPSLVVCNPDRPVGRKHIFTPPPVKIWAKKRNIKTFQPISFNHSTDNLVVRPLNYGGENESVFEWEWDLFVVVAYSTILPKWLIGLPKYGTINLHPSLLPKLRGASPIRSAILQNIRETGVTIIKLDEKMDHGPIIAQKNTKISKNDWPMRGRDLDDSLAQLGGSFLAKTIPEFVADACEVIEQNHSEATFCKKISKADSELQIDPHNLPVDDGAYQALLKIRAYDVWPGTFFMYEGKRIKITDAELSPKGQLRILSIIPEGKKETEFNIYFN